MNGCDICRGSGQHLQQPADSDETSSCDEETVDSESTVSDNTVAQAAIKSTDYGQPLLNHLIIVSRSL